MTQHNSNAGIDESSRFNMASLKINLPQNLKRSRGGLSRYYSGKSRSFRCLNEVDSIEDLKKQDYNSVIVSPTPSSDTAAVHHDSNNNNNNNNTITNKKRNTFSSSSLCYISSMSKDIKQQHTLFYA